RLGAGLAVLVVVSGFTTAASATARTTVPVVLAITLIGLVLAPRRRPGSEGWAAVVVTALTFLFYGAPVIVSGQPTFAGYVKLDDTATFLALTDRALTHGRGVSGLPPSSYRAALDVNLAHGYPL